MRGRIKSAMCNVNQMGEFWCFFVLMSYAGKRLNRGRLKRVLLYIELYLFILDVFIM